MNNILTDVSDAALITAIRLNMCELFRHSSRSRPAEHFENERFTRWHTPLAYPWFNGVLCSTPPLEGDEAFVQGTIQYFRDRHVSIFTWWMEPHLKPSDWQSLLTRYGFRFSSGSRGMAVELEAMNESLPAVEGFEIRAAQSEESMRVWAKVFVEGYGLPSEWEDAWLAVWNRMGTDFPVRNYIGYLHAEPVSTSSVFLGGGVAGIYCVATLPEARGKGIGSAITLQPLQEARAMGYRIGILQSSEMGFLVYKRLGFRHLCPIEYFYLKSTS